MLYHPDVEKRYFVIHHHETEEPFAVCMEDQAVYYIIEYKGDQYLGKRVTEPEMDEKGIYFDDRGWVEIRDSDQRGSRDGCGAASFNLE